MKADDIMNWLVEARNYIEKEGDLDLNSKFIISILENYNEQPYKVFTVAPTTTNEGILKKVKEQALPKYLMKNGIYKVERQWICHDLPQHELLNVLAHSFGVLSNLIKDAQKEIGIMKNKDGKIDLKGDTPHTTNNTDGRPRSMVDNVWIRSEFFNISTGNQAFISELPLPLISKEELQQHYPSLLTQSHPEHPEDFFGICDMFFERAKIMYKKDGCLVSAVIITAKNGEGQIINLHPKDRSDKWVLWEKVAAEVNRINADQVISISEVWMAPYDPKNTNMTASESINRKEGLELDGITFSGEQYSFNCPIVKQGDKVFLGKTTYSKNVKQNIFLPIKRVWSRRRFGDIYQPFRLGSKDPCPCRSGKTFKSCCKDQLKIKFYDQSQELFESKNYKKAEIAFRSWLTQYIVWYNEHTVPLLAWDPKAGEELVEIDRKALLSICVSIADCMMAQGRKDEVKVFFKNCSTIMNDQKFKDELNKSCEKPK